MSNYLYVTEALLKSNNSKNIEIKMKENKKELKEVINQINKSYKEKNKKECISKCNKGIILVNKMIDEIDKMEYTDMDFAEDKLKSAAKGIPTSLVKNKLINTIAKKDIPKKKIEKLKQDASKYDENKFKNLKLDNDQISAMQATAELEKFGKVLEKGAKLNENIKKKTEITKKSVIHNVASSSLKTGLLIDANQALQLKNIDLKKSFLTSKGKALLSLKRTLNSIKKIKEKAKNL